jgi:ketosteroid isomerase-like protein
LCAYSIIVIATLFQLITSNSIAQDKNSQMTARLALVQMEHDFAKAAAANGTRAAFLEFLADDGIVFQPGPVNGKKYWTAREPRKGLLSWEPVFADVSISEDLGYTTGPWEFRANGPQDKPAAFGQYFTIWKKQSDGSWKAVIDRGVRSDTAFPGKGLEFPTDHETAKPRNADVVSGRAELLKLEQDLSAQSEKRGFAEAFRTYFADDVRVLRDNVAPAINKETALELISKRAGTLTWQPTKADVSSAGDLGYSFGVFSFKSNGVSETGSYVHVWKKQNGKWQIVADVSSPDPQN